MYRPKDILVVTTSMIEGRPIEKYFKPISAHVVIGTNLFSDFLGGMTDVFGGRSKTYQRKLSTLYSEAIQELQQRAVELGANCIVGLSVDMDEISGGGKSMFMITATGTAAWAVDHKKEGDENNKQSSENVSLDSLITLNRKKEVIKKAEKDEFYFIDDDTWSFIIENKVVELFPFLMKKWREAVKLDTNAFNNFSIKMNYYISSLDDETKYKLIYEQLIREEEEKLIPSLSALIKHLMLVDYNTVLKYLNSEDFQAQKRILNVLIHDKPLYNENDLKTINQICELINRTFKERGQRSTKKGLLTSKEKEIWICECGHQNDTGEYCTCGKDIYGFKEDEVNFERAINTLKYRSYLVKECLNN